MTLEECKVGTLVRAMKDLAPGFWATGLILGEVVEQNAPLLVKFISHANYKEYEGRIFWCLPEHLVPVSLDKNANVDTNLVSLFDT